MRRLRVGGGRCKTLRSQLGAQDIKRLADHQRPGLRQRVGDEQRLLVSQRMRRAHRNDELDRHCVGALVEPLQKGVVAIRTCAAPQRRASSDSRHHPLRR